MAANRFGFKIDKGLSQTYVIQWVVASGGAATIASGTPTKRVDIDAATATGTVIPMVDGNGGSSGATLAVSGTFAGLAKSTSTDTAAAAGVVDVFAPVAGLVYRGTALSSTAANTQAKINVLAGKRVVYDLTTSNWTVDTAAADAVANNVVIVGGLPLTNEVLFVHDKNTILSTQNAITS